MAVNSKADKTHGHSVRSLQAQVGIAGKKTLSPKSYSAAPAPSPQPAGGAITPTGQKALGFRAKKELAPLADPNSPITE